MQAWWLYRVHHRSEPPLLSAHDLDSLATYKRRCLSSNDCEWPLSCIFDDRVIGRRCLASECQTDLQCQPGHTCRTFTTEPLLRLCVLLGSQREGERCEGLPLKRDLACAEGLQCLRGFCGRSCQIANAASCPEGFTCVDDAAQGPVCLPNCLQTGCPEGKRCFRLDGGRFAVCGLLKGEDCEKTPCAPGERCESSTWRDTEYVWMRCERPCAPDSQCPPGLLCFRKRCERPCNHDVPGSCGPGKECAIFPEDGLQLCIPQD